jgi:hypothetical protein
MSLPGDEISLLSIQPVQHPSLRSERSQILSTEPRLIDMAHAARIRCQRSIPLNIARRTP